MKTCVCKCLNSQTVNRSQNKPQHRTNTSDSHCLFSCSTDLRSSSSRALTAFTIVAWKSSAPLNPTDTHISYSSDTAGGVGSNSLTTSHVPGREDLRRPDVGDHVQEVVAHEDSSLQQQEGEADAVPDDPGLVTGHLAALIRGWNRQFNLA